MMTYLYYASLGIAGACICIPPWNIHLFSEYVLPAVRRMRYVWKRSANCGTSRFRR